MKMTIIDRLDYSLEAFALEGLKVRSIYLSSAEYDELLAAHDIPPAKPSAFPEYRGHKLRRTRGNAPSKIYSIHGIARAVMSEGTIRARKSQAKNNRCRCAECRRGDRLPA